MKRKILSAGLAGLLAGCVQLGTKDLPADNIYFGRHAEVFEGDLQDGVNTDDMSFSLNAQFSQTPLVSVIPLEDSQGRNAPFNVNYDCRATTEKAQASMKPYSVHCDLVLSDNNKPFISGEIWTIRVEGEAFGNIAVREDVHITYLKGNSNEVLTDEVENGMPPHDHNGGLDDVLNYACSLNRPTGDNCENLYEITSYGSNAFTSRLIAELDRNTPEGQSIYHLMDVNAPANVSYAIVERENPEGICAETFRIRETMKLVSPIGVVPENCNHVNYISNDDLYSQVFTVTSEPD